MIRRLLLFLISSFSFNLYFFNSGLTQSELQKLEILSEKPFELFINDFSIGIHTRFDTLLKSDIYNIEAFLIDTETVKTVFKQKLFLDNDRRIILDTIYPITIKSFPDDAKIYFDSLYFGSTPLKINLLFRPSLLEIKLPGYKNYIKDISNLSNYNFYIKLEKEKIEKSKFNIEYKYVALGSTIINGALAAYTKQLANKYFYKSDRTNDDLKKVKTYDRYSGIFTIAMEISFGIFVYLLFQE